MQYAQMYAEVVKSLGFEECVQRMVMRTANLIDAEAWEEQAFPPALIPLYSEPAGNIVGIWKHWGCDSRRLTVVNYSGATSLGEPRTAYELATSISQLKYIYFLNMLSYQPGVTAEVAADAHQFGFDDFDSVKRVLQGHGQRMSGLLELAEFKSDPPQSCFRDDPGMYRGDFPSVRSTVQQLACACSYEVHSWFQEDEYELRRRVSADPSSPLWFRSASQKETFRKMMDAKNACGAWMTLNSIGWRLHDARRAIQELGPLINNPVFDLLSAAWRQIPVPENLEY